MKATWLAIKAPLPYNRTLSPFTSWLSTCNHPMAITPPLFRNNRTTLSPSSLGGAVANDIQQEPCALSNPSPPHHLLLGGGGGGHLVPSRKPVCLDAALEAEPLPAPTPLTTIREWTHQLQSHSHVEFASLALLQKYNTCPPCMHGRIGGGAPPSLPNTSLCIRGVARHS